MHDLKEIRRQIEEALGYSSEHWLEQAVRTLQAHRLMTDKRYRKRDVSTTGARLRTAREVVGMTLRQLGARLGGVHHTLLSAYERGVHDMPAELLPRWCLVLGITQLWALGESEQGGPPMPTAILRRQTVPDLHRRDARQRQAAHARCERDRLRGLRPPLKGGPQHPPQSAESSTHPPQPA